MNKKGQVLVVFIIILPAILLVLGLVYDIGLITYTKKQAKDSIVDAINYGLQNKDNIDDIDYIITSNIKNIKNKNIDINDDQIKVEITFEIDGNFKKLFDSNIYKVDLKVTGYLEDGRIKIREWQHGYKKSENYYYHLS